MSSLSRKYLPLLAAALVLFGLLLSLHDSASAQVVVFQDTFDSEPIGTTTILTNWTVTGNVDVIGLGSADLYPGNGRYLDMDGTCGSATIQSTPINLDPGTYQLSFEIGNNPGTVPPGGGGNGLQVSLGTVFSQFFSAPSALTPIAVPFVVTTPTTASLVFQETGPSDCGGSVLDDVLLVAFTPQCVEPPSGMTGWWPGDGNANDIAGTNDGTLQNGATFAAGKVDQAFSFDGVNDFVQIPNAALNNMPAGTIDMWIFPISNGQTPFFWGKNWFGKQHDFVDTVAMFAFASPTDSRVLFHLRNVAPNVFGTTPLALNHWHHVAATWDGSFIRVYVDGVQDGVAASSLGLPSQGIGCCGPPVTSIGALIVSATNQSVFFDGRIDEVEIFNRALSAEEIQAIFLAGSAGKCKNEAPVAQCQNVTKNTSPGLCTAPASVNNGSFDPDGDPITLVQSPAGPYGKGTTNVTLTVSDDKGASDSCEAVVTVVDAEAPVITCPAPQTVECTGSGSAVASFSATATDNCGFASTSCPASGSSFPLGSTQVSCSATDDSNNTSGCASTVTVVDTTKPTVTAALVRVADDDDDHKGKHKNKGKNKKHGHGHGGKDDDDDEGRFQVQFSCSDICQGVTTTATLNGIPVSNGQLVELERDDKTKVKVKHGILEIEAPLFSLVVTCADGSGNVGTATATPVLGDDNDDHKRKGKNKGKN